MATMQRKVISLNGRRPYTLSAAEAKPYRGLYKELAAAITVTDRVRIELQATAMLVIPGRGFLVTATHPTEMQALAGGEPGTFRWTIEYGDVVMGEMESVTLPRKATTDDVLRRVERLWTRLDRAATPDKGTAVKAAQRPTQRAATVLPEALTLGKRTAKK